MNSQVVSKIPSRSQKSVSALSFFARLFNSAKTALFLVSIICLGGLFASPAEAVVKTYYVQQDGTCGSNATGGLIWQSAAEGSSNCGSRSRIGGADASGNFLVGFTPVFASTTTITGQTGSNIYFQEVQGKPATGEAQLVEVNAAGNAILTYFGTKKTRSYDKNSGSITDLSAQSGTINAGNRLGLLVSVTNTQGAEINFYYGQSGGAASAQAWFVVNEVPVNATPNVPTNLAQYKSDGSTVISSAGTTNETTVVIEADISDQDVGDTVKLQVDIDGNGTSDFESSLAATPQTNVQVSVTGLVDSQSYNWQVRTVDNSGAASNWVAFSGSPDFTVSLNAAPIIDTNAGTTATEDIQYTYNPTVSDPDGPGATWSKLGGDSCPGSTINSSTGAYAFTATGPNPIGSCTLSIQVCDGFVPNACDSETVTVSVTAVNDPPTITSSAPASATEDTLYSYTPTLIDPDGPATNWTVRGTDTCGGSFTAGSYNFTPAGPTPPASCQLDIQLCDGGTPDLCATETRTVTITAVDDPSTLTISQPNGQAVTAGTPFDISYTLSDPEGSATVTFSYDTDNTPGGDTLIGGCQNQVAGTNQSCSWDTSSMPEGTYYVFGVPSDSGASAYSAGQLTINPAGAATLIVTEPNGANDTIAEGGSFTVNYYLADDNDVTTVSFFYEDDGNGAGGTPISGCSNQPEAASGTCAWDTSIGPVASGSYYIYGTTSGDGAGDVTVVSPGTMTINHAPALSISEPNGAGDTVSAGSVYNISYTLTDANDTATAALYYDSDATGFNGTAISGCEAAAMGSGVTCAWDTSGMTPGNYYVYGIATDSFSGTAQSYSPGVITITPNVAATLVVNQPDGAGANITQGVSFTINYDLSDSDDQTTVAFFYDTNNSGADGTAIGGCTAKPEATGGTCSWSTASVESGSYYVYATTSGDAAGAATVYSLGTVTISTTPFSYADGDDGTNPWNGDSIAGISRSDGGYDGNNVQSGKPKIDVEYQFRINFIDNSGESPLVEPVLYIAHRDAPTEGAGGDFFVYPLACTGVTWGSGKTCTTTMKLGPVASHKFYFYAEKTDGTVISSGYIDGPQIQLIDGYSLVGVPRDIDSSNYDGYAAFYTPYSYGWNSEGLATPGEFNGTFVSVTAANPAKAGRGYFVYKWWGDTLPQLESDLDVTITPHIITLQAGWNLISNPYNGNVKLDDVQIRQNASTTNLWSDAAGAGWIESAVYYYQGSDWGDTQAPELAELVPWMGYWMYVKDDISSYELIVTQPAQ